MTSRSAHFQPLSPCTSNNSRSTHSSTGPKHVPTSSLPRKVMSDENTRPSSPVAVTLAEEMVRSGEPLKEENKLSSFGVLGDSNGALTVAESIGKGDITEIEIRFDDVQVPTPNSGCSMKPHLPTDVVSGEDEVSEEMASDCSAVLRTEMHTIQHDNVPQNVNVAAAQRDHPLVKSTHTLRERRMTYLRNMYAMLNEQEPEVPRAILPATSAVRATKWEIEVGVVGSWLKLPKRTIPTFVAAYDGFPAALLHRRRQAIIEEVRVKRSKNLHFQTVKPQGIPHNVDDEVLRWNNAHRLEIEEILRDADLDAGDLDETDMNGVVTAVMSAAAEAARLATTSF